MNNFHDDDFDNDRQWKKNRRKQRMKNKNRDRKRSEYDHVSHKRNKFDDDNEDFYSDYNYEDDNVGDGSDQDIP